MAKFNFKAIQSVEFGICLDTDAGESYRLVPCVTEVQAALKEMLAATVESLFDPEESIEEFSPAEKYGPTERLRIAISSEMVAKHRQVFETTNLATDTNGLGDVEKIVSYFAIFRDRAAQKLMAFRRAMQFKGILKKKLIRFSDDALRIIPDDVFKLDTDFDFIVCDGQILIWRPSGFVFTAGMDEHVAACAMQNVDHIAKDIACVDFSGLKKFVEGHKMGMRLVAAIRSRTDLAMISRNQLKRECKDSKIEVTEKNGKLIPTEGSELAFLKLLDRRRYALTLIPRKREIYEAASRHEARSADHGA